MATRPQEGRQAWELKSARDPCGVLLADIRLKAAPAKPPTAKSPAASSVSCDSAAGACGRLGSPDGTVVVHLEARCGAAGLPFAAPPRAAVWLALDSQDNACLGLGAASDAGSDASFRSAAGYSSAGSHAPSLSRCSSLLVPWTQLMQQHAAGVSPWDEPEPGPPARPQPTAGAARLSMTLLAAASRDPVGVVAARWRGGGELTPLGPPAAGGTPPADLPPPPPPRVRVPPAPCPEERRRLRRPSPVWQPRELRSFELTDFPPSDRED
ncbi:hypothetical protein Rsub_00198 [Raphidocelis subcapitata]|uniref:Uncharacterized protein n=1 Tax=Raphidocelis subcapitata TaxID=307507 RepID=A0A2V0NRD5_9CHLO|nr:hypothetical protein Rsub_00198 [Raphidocelis subcapitata]|eukprot:GBF87487.1 hypothetical protein Rsub_00198 [Raphidocelis subcapitata]